MKRIAIIGAGLSGLCLANALHNHADVVIFEKSNHVGGRMASSKQGKFAFDHGAQFFTAKSPEFKAFLVPFLNSGIVQRWDARFVEIDNSAITFQWQWDKDYPHYVAVPGMDGLCIQMQDELAIQFNREITQINSVEGRWSLTTAEQSIADQFDWVVLSLPAKPSLSLLPNEFKHTSIIQNKQMLSCYSLMLGFNSPITMNWDAALIRNRDISWISVNSSKPGRPHAFTLLAHSTNGWADRHLMLNDEDVKQHLLEEVESVIEEKLNHAQHQSIHCWHYANIGKQEGERCLIDTSLQLAAIGDWCIHGRVESAFKSAMACAEKLQSIICKGL